MKNSTKNKLYHFGSICIMLPFCTSCSKIINKTEAQDTDTHKHIEDFSNKKSCTASRKRKKLHTQPHGPKEQNIPIPDNIYTKKWKSLFHATVIDKPWTQEDHQKIARQFSMWESSYIFSNIVKSLKVNSAYEVQYILDNPTPTTEIEHMIFQFIHKNNSELLTLSQSISSGVNIKLSTGLYKLHSYKQTA